MGLSRPGNNGGGLGSGSDCFGDAARRAGSISINLGQGAAGGGLNERIIKLIALLTVLSLAPSILVMMTSFTRIVVVLSLLRTALGTATSPPNSVVISLALFLTAFVMGPVLTCVYDVGIKPLVANEINVNEAFERASGPLRTFMEKNVRDKDLPLFVDMSGEAAPAKPEDLSMRTSGPGLHDFRALARVRDRLPVVPAVPHHRSGRRLGTDVDGHDDAAAGRGVATVQADLLRPGRRLDAGRRLADPELWRDLKLSY